MNERIVDRLYAATEEGLRYGIGVLTLPGQNPAPCIQLHYGKWTRERLALVRSVFRAGLAVTWRASTSGFRDLHISTRERVAIQAHRDGHTSVLRAPAWDAHLDRIEKSVVRRFEMQQQRCGGCLFRLQTSELEFSSAVSLDGAVQLGPIQLRRFPIPGNATKPE